MYWLTDLLDLHKVRLVNFESDPHTEVSACGKPHLIIDVKKEAFWNVNQYIDQLLSGIETLIAAVIN